MVFNLVFRGEIIGKVHQEDEDFPTCFGRVHMLPVTSRWPLLERFIAYSLRVWPLIEADACDDPAFAEESDYEELVNDDSWILRDAHGRDQAILIPVFTTDHGINWRWNCSPD